MLAAGGQEEDWIVRYQERRTNELRLASLLRAYFGAVEKALGTPHELAVRGTRLSPYMDRNARIAYLSNSFRLKLDPGRLSWHRERLVLASKNACQDASFRGLAILGLSENPRTGKDLKKAYFGPRATFQDKRDYWVRRFEQRLIDAGYAEAEALARLIVDAADPEHPMSVPDLAKMIRAHADDLTRRRSMVLAQAFTAEIYGSNQYADLKRLGIKRRRLVTAAGSPSALTTPVCDKCAAIAALGWVDIDEPMIAEYMAGVRNPHLETIEVITAPVHPGPCRCDIVGDVGGGWLPKLFDWQAGDEPPGSLLTQE